jgi:hypothetical protein
VSEAALILGHWEQIADACPCGCWSAVSDWNAGEVVVKHEVLNGYVVEECADCGATWSYVEWCDWYGNPFNATEAERKALVGVQS